MKKPTNPMRFHLWFPNVFEFKGGIQVYSAFLLTALQTLYPDQSYTVLLKHDTKAVPGFAFLPSTQFRFAGNVPLALRTGVFAAQLIGLALWQRPHLVIATHLNFTVAAYWLKRFTGIPYWTIAHGVEAWDIQRRDLQVALREADKIISVSGYTRDRLLKEQDLDATKVAILPNTFDADRFCIAPKPDYLLTRYGLTLEQPVILTVARLDQRERYKGYDRILEALPEISRHIPNVHYILAGKGDDRPRVEALIHRLGIQDYVTLTGFIPDVELASHYHLCDVFAMPSKGEGFGIVYLEALASGKPTLGGNQDGAIDALCHGELGVLVNPDDVQTIAQSLVQILQKTYPHPILYQPEVLRQKVIETFGQTRFQQTLAELMQTMGGLESGAGNP